MTTTELELTPAELHERFQFVSNHFVPHAEFDGVGCFETYGQELEYVCRQDARTVWTVIDDNAGTLLLMSGRRVINRLLYLISREPVPEYTTVTVYYTIDGKPV